MLNLVRRAIVCAMTTNTDQAALPQVTDPADPADAANEASDATPESTRAKMLRFEARGFTPIRHTFVQQPLSAKVRKAKLGEIVTARQGRELNAYLLLLVNHARLTKEDHPWPAGAWARALSSSAGAPLPNSAVSRIWKNLGDLELIDRSRKWRRAHVLPRDESGKRKYARPRPDMATGEKKEQEIYFILPAAFWTDGWHENLTLPGRAVLLILLHETSGRDETYLPYEQADNWYGISAKTAQRGIHELMDHKLITVRSQRVAAEFSATGWADRRYFTLTGPFSRAARTELQNKTARESAARSSKGEGSE
ncbi:hypothetical protein RHA1_ro10458 (plasmid) [Rhodococcus jostii RHA1]|uniref:Uncharacterized protein n=1 Tax=Rhodococcus jostii (strain RHA1) TaxID=101510 RepID=Q0RVN9_RHOJR|nr:hypothetical protein [Rhodococcus jostii]ABH00647.1 hypothetical protein RHA1_ro10458 [Rhodococcus jostii RHA1]